MVNATGQQVDAFGNPIKQKNTPIPPIQGNQQNQIQQPTTPAIQGAVAQPPATQTVQPQQVTPQGSQQTVNAANQTALNTNNTSQIQNTNNNAAQALVGYMGSYDPQASTQATVEQADTDWAKTFEAARQQNGAASGSGEQQSNQLSQALQHSIDQNTLKNTTEIANRKSFVDNMVNALNTSNSVSTENQNSINARITNLTNATANEEGAAQQYGTINPDGTRTQGAIGNAAQNTQTAQQNANTQTADQQEKAKQDAIQNAINFVQSDGFKALSPDDQATYLKYTAGQTGIPVSQLTGKNSNQYITSYSTADSPSARIANNGQIVTPTGGIPLADGQMVQFTNAFESVVGGTIPPGEYTVHASNGNKYLINTTDSTKSYQISGTQPASYHISGIPQA